MKLVAAVIKKNDAGELAHYCPNPVCGAELKISVPGWNKQCPACNTWCSTESLRINKTNTDGIRVANNGGDGIRSSIPKTDDLPIVLQSHKKNEYAWMDYISGVAWIWIAFSMIISLPMHYTLAISGVSKLDTLLVLIALASSTLISMSLLVLVVIAKTLRE